MFLLSKHEHALNGRAVTWAMASSLTDVSHVFIPGTMLTHAFNMSVTLPLCDARRSILYMHDS